MKRKIQAPFRKFATFLIGKLPMETLCKDTEKWKSNLEAVSEYGKPTTIKEYYIEKVTIVLTAAFWGISMLLLAGMVLEHADRWIKDGVLIRPEYHQGERETEVELFLGEEEEGISIPIKISPRKMTEQQLAKCFNKAIKQLEGVMLGNNRSMDDVRTDLNLISELKLEEGVFYIEWYTEPADLINHKGEILREVKAAGELAKVRGVLKCQQQEVEYTTFAMVYPAEYTKEEVFLWELEKEIEKADADTIHEKEIKLPQTVEGVTLKWKKPRERIIELLIMLLIVILIVIYIGKDREIVRAVKKRKQQMVLYYPMLVFKLTVLLGAGLTIRTAFTKIAKEIQGKKEKDVPPVYLEVQITCHEMEMGVAEAQAYENFGKRCQEESYIKLGSILAQNLKKGSKGLISLLEQEAFMNMEEQKAAVKKLGEEAGTKLLLPMVLMLMIVLVILIIPAFMYF